MKLSLIEEDIYLLEGNGEEFKWIVSQLMKDITTVPNSLETPSIVDFYKSLITLSSKDSIDSLQLHTDKIAIEWLFSITEILPKLKEEVRELIEGLKYQYYLLSKKKDLEEPTSLEDELFIQYQDVLGVQNIKKMIAFVESFGIDSFQLQKLVISKFEETYPSVKTEDIRFDMLERIYHHFFAVYQSLLIETHLLLSFPKFKEKLSNYYREQGIEKEGKGLLKNGLLEEDRLLGLYLIYWDIFLKGMEDGFVYNADDSDMIFEWFKSLFMKIAEEYSVESDYEITDKELAVEEDEIEAEVREKMMKFRGIYIEEISKYFDNIEAIEDDEEIPYNVVLKLKDNKKVVCNTLRHYQLYIEEEVKGLNKERVRSMRDFITRIAPSQSKTKNASNLLDGNYDDLKEDILPMIRRIESVDKEAIHTPLIEGLGIYYGIKIEKKGSSQFAMIMNAMAKKWGISDKVLYKTAIENLTRKSPSFIKYIDMIKQQLTGKEIQELPKAYQEIYIYGGESIIDSSYILDERILIKLKEELNTEELIISIPTRDSILVTDKKNISYLKEFTSSLYETESTGLTSEIFKWSIKGIEKIK